MDKKIKELFLSRKGNTVYNTVLSTMHTHGMDNMLCSGVLLGFSGGADSVFLASLLVEYKRRTGADFQLVLCHVNHGIRGAEAKRDEDFSRAFAESLGLEFVSVSLDIPTLSKESGKGLEEAARDARYSAFDDIIKGRNDISVIATAHNSTDNVETVIFNLTRGAGSKGATGIAPIRDNIIRPLINIPKSMIVGLLDENKIDYVTDSTNYSSEYSRNYIRHEILPRLSHLNPRFEEAFGSFTDALRADLDYISSTMDPDVFSSKMLDRDMLIGLHPSVLSRAVGAFCDHNGVSGLDRKQITAISDLLRSDNFRYSLDGGKEFVCERGKCYISLSAYPDNDLDFCIELKEGENKLGKYSAVITLGEFKESSSNVYKISIQQNLSSAIIIGSLHVRFRRDGDAYFYGGMTHKLKKVFNDRGIPPSKRGRVPVVFDDKGIVWVPGLGVRDDGVRSDEKRPISFSVLLNGDEEELYSALTEA